MRNSTQHPLLTRALKTIPLALLCVQEAYSFSTGFVTSSRASCVKPRPARSSQWKLLVASTSSVDLEQDSPPYLASYNGTINFPSYSTLMQLQYGEHVTSDAIRIPTSTTNQDTDEEYYEFCVKLYPRGGGHASTSTVISNNKNTRQKSGFGMSYKVLPLSIFDSTAPPLPKDEKVGVYLQFLPHQSKDKFVDATFGLQLVGNQTTGRKFNVEWRAGMRFVEENVANLQEGTANDFGAHLMQTLLLQDFLGCETEENQNQPLKMMVDIQLHHLPTIATDEQPQERDTAKSDIAYVGEENESFFSNSLGLLRFDDIRETTLPSPTFLHNTDQVRVGRIVVPILRKLSQRPRMFALGAYPGVEYRIMRIFHPTRPHQELFYSRPGANYELKPIYPLVQELERPWPVTVKEEDIPKLYTPQMYNAVSALGSLLTALTGLLLAFSISQAVSLFVIPSRSMDPTLQVGDVLLVEKVTPRLFGQYHSKGDVVLFHPPTALQEIVQRSGGKPLQERDLFVKRVAGEPGDVFSVNAAGDVWINGAPVSERRDMCTAEPLRLIEKFIQPTRNAEGVEEGATAVGEKEVLVLGDCSSVSIDSRVWGALPTKDIVGRPVGRLWPPARFGSIPPLPTTVQEKWD